MPSTARRRFEGKVVEIEFLLEIHEDVVREGGSREFSKLQVLHKSGIVLLTAAWEMYVESILMESIAFLSAIGISGNSSAIQYRFLQRLAVSGVETLLGQFHTPSSANTRKHFRDVLGIDDITRAWGREGLTPKAAKIELDGWLNDRHAIAHGAASDAEFLKEDVERFLQFLTITVANTDDETKRHLVFLTGTDPW